MFFTGIPKTMKAVVFDGTVAKVQDKIKVPFVDDGFLLIQVLAVAANPMDWKHVEFGMGPKGAILGCDVAGVVVTIGSGIPADEYKVGDNVCAFVHGGSFRKPGNGAFAQFCAVDANITFKLPETMMLHKHTALKPGQDFIEIDEGPVDSIETAATMPVALITAGAILVHELGLNLEWEPVEPQINSPVLVWGGATSVGQILIQVIKKLNAFSKIITVASKKHEDLLHHYGADVIYDYHDKDILAKIQANHKDITFLVDAVSSEETINQVYQCASANSSATVLQMEYLNIEQIEPTARRDDVKIIGTLIYLISGYEVKIGDYHFPANPRFRKDLIRYIKFINPKLIDGEIHHIPTRLYRNGLADIPIFTEMLKHGKISGNKLVTSLEDEETQQDVN